MEKEDLKSKSEKRQEKIDKNIDGEIDELLSKEERGDIIKIKELSIDL